MFQKFNDYKKTGRRDKQANGALSIRERNDDKVTYVYDMYDDITVDVYKSFFLSVALTKKNVHRGLFSKYKLELEVLYEYVQLKNWRGRGCMFIQI